MGLNILVAEDSVAYAVLYQQIFESRGHTVKLTLDGEECMSAYAQEAAKKQDSQNPFDVVILDHSMPKKTGFDVAKEILETKPNQKIMIITGFDDEISAKLKQSDMGKNIEVIEKPFNSSVLINKIERETMKEKASHVLIS
ncbi:MAG TPA: response regulator [Candidatus Nitrosotenuis sp.]|jgi:two-component system cell cycle response regulator CpdR